MISEFADKEITVEFLGVEEIVNEMRSVYEASHIPMSKLYVTQRCWSDFPENVEYCLIDCCRKILK